MAKPTPRINEIFNSGVICHAIAIADRAGILEAIEAHAFVRIEALVGSGHDRVALIGLVRVLELAGIVQSESDGTVRAGEQFSDCMRRKGLFTWFFAASAPVLLAAHNKLVRSLESVLPSRDGSLVGSTMADFGRRNVDRLLLSLVDWKRYKCVLDIGCGDASRIQSLVSRCEIEAVGLDASRAAIEGARERLGDDLAGRIHLLNGDAVAMEFDPYLRPRIDVAMMALMAHDLLPPERAVRTLQRWRVQLPNLQRLVICETVKASHVDPATFDREVPEVGYEFLHTLMGIEVESDLTWRDILRRAGWQLVEAHDVALPANTVIYVCDADQVNRTSSA